MWQHDLPLAESVIGWRSPSQSSSWEWVRVPKGCVSPSDLLSVCLWGCESKSLHNSRLYQVRGDFQRTWKSFKEPVEQKNENVSNHVPGYRSPKKHGRRFLSFFWQRFVDSRDNRKISMLSLSKQKVRRYLTSVPYQGFKAVKEK